MNDLKEKLRSRIPNIRFIRKKVSQYRVREINASLLDADTVHLCEKDSQKKAEVVRNYLARATKDTKLIQKLADETLRGLPQYRDRRAVEAIRTDMLFCRNAYGFKPGEYIAFQLEGKQEAQRREYVSDLVRVRYHCRMNDLSEASLFKDKFKTYTLYRDDFRREAISIANSADFSVFEAFVHRHPVFVKKQSYESLGRSVELLDMTTCGMTERQLFDTLIARGKHILEEKIEQSPALSAFHQNSVNTVRCITFLTKDGVFVPYCILRMGHSGSFVDNGGAGGLIACVDYETGLVSTDGYDEIGNIFTAHPDSGTVFKGYQLPDWDQLHELCDRSARKVPKIKYIGWDLAHTPDGWVIVEGNAGSQMIGQQMILGGMRKTMEELTGRMELMC